MQYLGPETRVLTRELLWKPLGDLRVGEILWGFDPEPVRPFTEGRGQVRRNQNRARRTKLAVIEDIRVLSHPAFLLSTDSGRELVASREQSFLGYSRDSVLRWRTVKSFSRPYNGHAVPALASWLVPWEQLADFDAGWLSGMFDGEGHVSVRQGRARSILMGLSQRRGPVLERAKQILLREQFSIGGYDANGTNKDVTNLQVLGGLQERIRALGLFRPIRLMEKLVNSDCDFEVWLRPDPIVRIEPIGPTDLLSIETSTGTFFAEGFATCSWTPASATPSESLSDMPKDGAGPKELSN